jgi:hypothetical protein
VTPGTAGFSSVSLKPAVFVGTTIAMVDLLPATGRKGGIGLGLAGPTP